MSLKIIANYYATAQICFNGLILKNKSLYQALYCCSSTLSRFIFLLYLAFKENESGYYFSENEHVWAKRRDLEPIEVPGKHISVS